MVRRSDGPQVRRSDGPTVGSVLPYNPDRHFNPDNLHPGSESAWRRLAKMGKWGILGRMMIAGCRERPLTRVNAGPTVIRHGPGGRRNRQAPGLGSGLILAEPAANSGCENNGCMPVEQ
jgi:hypothetical protein